MRVLLDTNIVLRYIQLDAEEHSAIETAIDTLLEQGAELCLVPQVMYEYWSAATRPYGAKNGLSMTSEETASAVAELTATFKLLPDTPQLYDHWLYLVVAHQVMGKQVHDTRLVAAMKVHDLDALLTYNAGDFKRFDIRVLSPNTMNSETP